MKGEKGEGKVKRPVTYLDEDDFVEIERFRKRWGLEKSMAITVLVRMGYNHPELYEEVEKG